MKLIEDGNKDQPVHLPFDAAMAGLASGSYELHEREGERGPDQPAAQSPKPGTDPLGGKEQAGSDTSLTNLSGSGASEGSAAVGSQGLPKEPEKPKEAVVKAPQAAIPVVLDPATKIEAGSKR